MLIYTIYIDNILLEVFIFIIKFFLYINLHNLHFIIKFVFYDNLHNLYFIK